AKSAIGSRHPLGNLLDVAPDPQQVAAPELGDLRFAEPTPTQSFRYIRGLRGVVPPGNAAATIEVGGQSDVVDAGDLDGVLDVIQVIVQVGYRELLLDTLDAGLVRRQGFVQLTVELRRAGLLGNFRLQCVLGRLACGVGLQEVGVG